MFVHYVSRNRSSGDSDVKVRKDCLVQGIRSTSPNRFRRTALGVKKNQSTKGEVVRKIETQNFGEWCFKFSCQPAVLF